MIDLEGKFLDHVPKKSILGIKVSKEAAACREGQLLLWMTCNLACRLKNMVDEVEVCVPPGIRISAPRYMPFGASGSNLKTGLSDAMNLCARECNVVFVKDDLRPCLDAAILVGPNTMTRATAGMIKNVACDGWLAYVGGSKDLFSVPHSDSNNPFGAFAAACIAVGEVFKFTAGLKPDSGAMIDKLCFSTYEPACHSEIWNNLENPPLDNSIDIGQLHVCGAGAVAHAFCQTLFPIGGLKGRLIFIDRSKSPACADETIDSTNLARYVMAANCDEGKFKAELLAERMSATGIQVDFSDEGLEEYVNQNTGSFSNIVSCVDNNHARHAIQDQIPKIVHGGSTEGLRTQVSIYDLGSKYCQCMKCYNPVDNVISDDAVQEKLKKVPEAQRKAIANNKNIDPEKLERYLQNPECGTLGGESIQKFADLDNTKEFSVNFVSTLTGVLLAAEIVKSKYDSLRSTLCGKQNTDLYYRFWTNTSDLGISKSEPHCWCNKGVPTPRDTHEYIHENDKR